MKTIFIVAGFKHSAHEEQYEWMKRYFESLGFTVKTPNIRWNNRTMTDYTHQFINYYNKYKSEVNYILGFSFGAMISLITADKLKPDSLYLCSLSPYFKEDLPTIKKSWRRYIGKKRIEDFESYSGITLAKRISMPTVVFYGTQEAGKYPQLKVRCTETKNLNSNCRLIIAQNAPHEIDYPTYIEAIKSSFTD